MGIKILIVDDALFMRQLVRNLLKEHGFDQIIEASNGKVAVNLYREEFPDLVICDVIMPEMNGLEAISAIIKINPDAKVVMLSALDEQETVINALHLGAKDYMIKPINKRNFIRTIRRVLAIDVLENEQMIMLEIYTQIIDDLENYIDSSLTPEIQSQISYILRSIEFDHPQDFTYDEKHNHIQLKRHTGLNFQGLNSILLQTLQKAREKVESFIPYAKNIFTETFRFVYLRNRKLIKTMENPIKFPEWLESEINFVDQVMEYLFPKE